MNPHPKEPGATRRAPSIVRRTGADWISPPHRLTAWERERRDGPIHPMWQREDWRATIMVTLFVAIAAVLLVFA